MNYFYKLDKNLWKFSAPLDSYGSNSYILKTFDKKLKKEVYILIDTSTKNNENYLKDFIKFVGKIKLSEISVVVLTHSHPDHIGNLDLFKDIEIFASTLENKYFSLNFKNIESYVERWKNLEIINTPGHTIGSICLKFRGENKTFLISGDTLFFRGVGRTDLDSGSEAMLLKSLELIDKLKYEVLCPGHDY